MPLEIYIKPYKVKHNDIIMSIIGENKEDISKGLAYLGYIEVAIGGDIICFSHHNCNLLYLVYLLNSPYGIAIKRQLATGDIILHISNDRLSSVGISSSLINEQNEIVSKIIVINRLVD